MLDNLLEYDKELFLYLNGLGVENYDTFWSLITKVYFWIPLYLLFIFLLYKNQLITFFRKSLVYVFGLLTCTMGLTEIVKRFFMRVRPSNNLEFNRLIRVLQEPGNYSFFSGHAANSFAITTFVILVLRKKQPLVWLFYLWPVLFSFSRIYVGVHYPTDILVGIMVGVTLAVIFYTHFKKKVLNNPAKR